MKSRFASEKITPIRAEINTMEVLKKIVESGWIITTIEMKQILNFLGIRMSMVQGKENYQFKKFIEQVLSSFDIDE